MKDRLEELRGNVEKYDNDEDLNIAKHFAVVDMDGESMSDVFYKVNFLGNAIDKLAELINIIQSLQNAMLAPLPDMQSRNKLEDKILEIRQLGNTIRKNLNEMKKMQGMDTNTDEKNARQRIIEIHTDILTERFCNEMNKYYKSVVTYQEQCRTRIARQMQIAGFENTDDEIDKLLENGHSFLYPEIRVQLEKEKQTLYDMEARHLDIMKCEDSIRELHALFIDLADLINRQGADISSIADHVKNADEYLETIPNILPLKKSNRPAKKIKICLIMSLFCFMIILVSVLLRLIKTI